jgi:hypothetical protein
MSAEGLTYLALRASGLPLAVPDKPGDDLPFHHADHESTHSKTNKKTKHERIPIRPFFVFHATPRGSRADAVGLDGSPWSVMSDKVFAYFSSLLVSNIP